MNGCVVEGSAVEGRTVWWREGLCGGWKGCEGGVAGLGLGPARGEGNVQGPWTHYPWWLVDSLTRGWVFPPP